MLSVLPLFAQNDGDTAAGLGVAVCFGVFALIMLVIGLVTLVGVWKIFEKAGKPGWAALIPIYNYYILNEIAGKEMLWFVLSIIPCTAWFAVPMILMDVAKNFGKDPLYGLGMFFVPPIFIPMLGFSNAVYRPVPKSQA